MAGHFDIKMCVERSCRNLPLPFGSFLFQTNAKHGKP